MGIITEDYISFETAKLLKEKGFKGECFAAYNGNGKLYGFNEEVDDNVPYWSDAPTQAMAMKWLREIHKINIDIHYNRYGENYRYLIIYKPVVLDDIRSLGDYFSYEEACEAAIKYCLENLI